MMHDRSVDLGLRHVAVGVQVEERNGLATAGGALRCDAQLRPVDQLEQVVRGTRPLLGATDAERLGYDAVRFEHLDGRAPNIASELLPSLADGDVHHDTMNALEHGRA